MMRKNKFVKVYQWANWIEDEEEAYLIVIVPHDVNGCQV